MELVYFWMEKFGTEKNQSINFKQDYIFKVQLENGKYKLTFEENENKIPKDYFGKNISNISCIIGNNGSGKTSLIKKIFRLKHYLSKNLLDDNYILIFKENNNIKIETNIKKEKIQSDFKVTIINTPSRNTKYIYFSNDFNPMNESHILNVFDISLKNKLSHNTLNYNTEQYLTGLNFITILHEINYEDIAMFIIDDEEKFIEKIPYENLRKKLENIQTDGVLIYTLKEQFSKYEKSSYYKKVYDKINISQKTNLKNFKDKFILNSWKYISNLFAQDIENKSLNEEEIKILNKRKNSENLEEWFRKQLKFMDNIIKKYNDKMFAFKNFYPSLALERIFFEQEFFFDFFSCIKDEYIENEMSIQFPYSENNKKNIKKFCNSYSIRHELLKFTFNNRFSNGEFILLYLLKEIFNLKSNINLNGEGKNIIFFIEEMESFLHPEWQRRIIELLKIVAENCPWLNNKKVQFILTSHTPLLVGDLPQGNIKKINNFSIEDLESNPFGDNLLNIFKTQFQLESLFSEHIRSKIKNYANKDGLSTEEREELAFLIDNIEEKLIKENLEELYNKFESKELKIKKLKKELAELEGELSDKTERIK